MTVKELSEKLSLSAIHMPDPDRAVTGGYCGDLLSWVMGRAEAGCAWVTIMSNVNTVAVAVLADCACVVIAEDAEMDADALARAKTQGVNLLSSSADNFTLCVRIAKELGIC